jgi:hypothetical protein
MIKVEQTAQPLGFMNRPVLPVYSFVGEGDDIGESLMIAFMLVVGQKLLERVAQGTFAKENQLSETFIFDGTAPAFGEGVEVGGLGWEFEGFNASGAEGDRKSLGEFGVAVVEEEAGIGHGPVRGDVVAGDLF